MKIGDKILYYNDIGIVVDIKDIGGNIVTSYMEIYA
jgi:hypothetical protein